MAGLSRAERLREMERLYLMRSYSDVEMAERLSTAEHRFDRTTIFRDRGLLETEFPFVQDDDGRYRIDRTQYISSIRVDLREALSLYLAARRASQQGRSAQRSTASALEKLATALRQPMTERLVQAADRILSRTGDPEREKIFETAAQAWAEGRCLRLRYQGLRGKTAYADLFAVYLIEPSPWSDSVYLIGRSDHWNDIAVYKLDRIERASLSGEPANVPEDFDEQALLRYAWGIWRSEKEPEPVQLRFAPGVATRRVKESTWHPLEKVTDTEDGGCLWEAPIAEWQEMLPFIRGWGADVEVIGSEGLRESLKNEVQRMACLYGVSEMKPQDSLIAHRRERDGKEQSLIAHLIEASQWAECFAAKVGLPEVGKIMGLLHDFGKASNRFQGYLRSKQGLISPDEDGYVDAKRGEVDHSTAGAQLIYEKLLNRGNEGKFLAQFLALAIASHHSGLIDCLKPDGFNDFERRISKDDNSTHLAEARSKLPDIEKQLDEILAQPIEKGFYQFVFETMIEPNESKEVRWFKRGLLARFLLSCVLEADRLNTADFENPGNEEVRNYGKYVPWEILIERLEAKFVEFAQKTASMEAGSRACDVNQLRAQVAQACLDAAQKPKGIYQLTVPTGGGKTLASLRFALHHALAHGMERVFYIVPYITIIDQNADKVRGILEKEDERGKVVLEHHSNFVPEEDTRHRHNLLAENWDAPIVFTTQVQFLEALFGSGTRDARRMHQLANSVIILDEVQTIPIRITHMFTTALRFLTHDCGATVVLCTATQPPLDKLPENPYRALTIQQEQKIIQDEPELFKQLKRVEVHDERKPGGLSNTEITDLAERALQAKGSVLIVVNTRSSAQALYQEIKGRQLGATTYHLSTNMCPTHRVDVLDEIKTKLKADEPVICVSTQLIEAGVDIDFGAVIRSLAGLDSIAQAAGRCNRNGAREGLGSVWVVNPQEENLDRLPDIKIGRGYAERVLDDFRDDPKALGDDRIGLDAIAAYYNFYYQARKDQMRYLVNANSGVGRNDDLFNLLSVNKLSTDAYMGIHQSAPEILLRQSFKSAAVEFQVIDSPTRGVVVPYNEGVEVINDLCSASFALDKQGKLLKRAQQYSVNLFECQVRNLLEAGAIKEVQEGVGIYHLDAQYYSEEYGWSDRPVRDMNVLIVESKGGLDAISE